MIITSFNLGPASIDFLTSEHSHDLVKNPSSSPLCINFEHAFVTPPKVVIFFNLLDIDQKKGCHIRTTISKIDRNGFTLTIESWGDTILCCAHACWIAYPENCRCIFVMILASFDAKRLASGISISGSTHATICLLLLWHSWLMVWVWRSVWAMHGMWEEGVHMAISTSLHALKLLLLPLVIKSIMPCLSLVHAYRNQISISENIQ